MNSTPSRIRSDAIATLRFVTVGLLAIVCIPAGLASLFIVVELFPDKSSWQELRGTVVDAETRRPIPGATLVGTSGAPLQIILNHDEARTNANGAYSLRAAWGQATQVTVRADGYLPSDQHVNGSTLPEPIALRRIH